ncbi:hypothetical protein [Desmospora activa]|uniref:UDP-N-acetylmuramyl pentapeptide phosphotransferase/UDP-N-acetylglucosamine-1-phosphate transferase n=1 Tax=Desmospora activa DSM 45169 TaxID=1121389 RepID=A0A2T4Z9I7_9BACL|nr:hypothetical protein [Desmospora activa]PTM58548.1 UDP-N-acetylmuramyl pentapeptide phosphotransferase/UDP-N-acetylglucosamine-1-phosphate transferase [Desmospora activa DSM 45169]
MIPILSIIILAISILTGVVALPVGIHFLQEKKLISPNFRGSAIPTSYGGLLAFLYLLLSVLLLGIDQSLALPLFSLPLFFAMLAASLGAAWLGWLDDTMGDHVNKGLAGHFRAWLREGTMTTGMIKAWGGIAIAAVAAVVTSGGTFWLWPLHLLFIALVTNWLNLLDLRPGRCLKFYLIVAVLLTLLYFNQSSTLLFLPLLGLALAVFRADLSARVMLGDSGSNLLGVQLGIWLATVCSAPVIAVFTILLIVGHVIGETISLTRIIEKSRWLSYLDRLGRGEH